MEWGKLHIGKQNLLLFGCGLLFLLLLGSFKKADDTPYLEVKVKNGEGMLSLLRRYHLAGHPCNLKQFLRLNKIKPNAKLNNGKSYFLPIQVYTYNGKSIRSTLSIKDIDQARRIQTYNELVLKDHLRKNNYRDSKILWVPYHELFCQDEVEEERVVTPDLSKQDTGEKDSKGNRRFPIFGEKYAYVPLIDKKLKGKIFYVESGHGGPDPGAIGKVGIRSLCEDEYAYDVALRVARILIEHNATVFIITRDPNDGIRPGKFLLGDSDELTYPAQKIPRKQKPRLFQRSDEINKLYNKYNKLGVKDQRLIVIHVESRGNRQSTDVFFYYHPTRKDEKKLAERMHKNLMRRYKHREYDGRVSGRDLHMLRECKPTTVFVELGNIRNSYDQQRLVLENNRQALANWLYEGLISPAK